jgi:tyrosinase
MDQIGAGGQMIRGRSAFRQKWMRMIATSLTATALIPAAVTGPTRASSVASDASEPAPRVRKSVQALTADERREFIDAVLLLKTTPSPFDGSLNYYDQFVAWHLTLSLCQRTDPTMKHMQRAHFGPMFLPWHREFVLLFENALRQLSGKDIAVPYWDWTDPASVASVFADDFMGGNGDPDEDFAVTTGPFRKGAWTLNVQPVGLEWSSSATTYITRRMGAPGELPTTDDVAFALAAPLYDVPPYDPSSDPTMSFRNALEGWRPPLDFIHGCGPDGVMVGQPLPVRDLELHNAVHAWVGGVLLPNAGTSYVGTMLTPPTSVNDPVFFLHHSNIDRIWAQWQEAHGVDTYVPRAGSHMNNVDDVMHPFEEDGIVATPATVADIHELGYRYE